jgi:hypothetical protein
VVRLSPDGWITLLPPLRPDGRKILQKAEPSDQPIIDQYGALVGYEVTLPAEADPARYLMQAEVSTDAAITGVADLLGYSLDDLEISDTIFDLVPGSSFWITTFWNAHGGAGEDYDLVIRLIDDAGRQWAQTDGPLLEGAYPTSMWRSGEKVADARLLWVDPNAPPGRYRLAVAFFDNLTDSRLPVTGGSVPDTIYLGPLKVPLPPPAESPEGVQPQSARFGDVAQLLGHGLTSQPNYVSLLLYWKADLPDSIDYTIFVHLLDENGQLVMGHDNQPVSGNYPTGIWEPGEIILDEYTFNTSELPPGEYQIEIGMYLLETGERLPVYLPDGTENVARQLILTTPVEVQ